MLALSRLFRCQHNLVSCWFKVNLMSSYVEYSNFCNKGKVVTLADITCANYVKKPCEANMCTLGWTFKKALNDETLNCCIKKILLDFFLNRQIITIHLINYIDFNNLLHHVNNFKTKIQLQYIYPCAWNDRTYPHLSKWQLPLSKNVIKFVHLCPRSDRLCP